MDVTSGDLNAWQSVSPTNSERLLAATRIEIPHPSPGPGRPSPGHVQSSSQSREPHYGQRKGSRPESRRLLPKPSVHHMAHEAGHASSGAHSASPQASNAQLDSIDGVAEEYLTPPATPPDAHADKLHASDMAAEATHRREPPKAAARLRASRTAAPADAARRKSAAAAMLRKRKQRQPQHHQQQQRAQSSPGYRRVPDKRRGAPLMKPSRSLLRMARLVDALGSRGMVAAKRAAARQMPVPKESQLEQASSYRPRRASSPPRYGEACPLHALLVSWCWDRVLTRRGTSAVLVVGMRRDVSFNHDRSPHPGRSVSPQQRDPLQSLSHGLPHTQVPIQDHIVDK